MSEVRVNQIEANEDSISFIGITTFSGTGSFKIPGGNTAQRPEVPKEGQVRYINGDVKKGLEYYNGTEWLSLRVANGESYEGITPIGVFVGGGLGVTNTIDYITISSLSNATDFGDLTRSNYGLAACSSSTRGTIGGGQPYPSPEVNIIDYITFTTTGNATDFGDLTQARVALGACSSSIRGVFAGGYSYPTPGRPKYNIIDYITIATIGNATDFGDLTSAKNDPSGCSSSTRGIFAGGDQGIFPNASLINIIDYITIATTGNATDFGDLTSARLGPAACSSSTRGVFGGGYVTTSPYATNIIDYITIATTGNATDFGDLTSQTYQNAACSSSTRGVFGGGYTNANTNAIDYITISTIGNATDFGDLTLARRALAACSNNHGGLLAS